MKTIRPPSVILAAIAVVACASFASACDVAVQSFGVQAFAAPVCNQAVAVQSYAAPVAVQSFAVQSYAVPSVAVFATPVVVQQVNVHHAHVQRQQVVRTRTVTRVSRF